MAVQKFRVDLNLLQNKIQNALLDPVANDPGSPLEGQVWFNTTDNVLKYYDGSATHVLLSASSQATLTNKTFDANGTGNSISNIEVADFASGVLDTDLSSVAGTDTTIPSAKAVKDYVDGRTYDNISYRQPVDLVFNSSGNALPATTATQIDSTTVTNGMRVLVLDSSTAGEDYKVYSAAVSGSDITWTVQQDGTGADAPADGHTIWVKSGTLYADQRYTFNGTEWVQTSGSGSIPDATTSIKGKVELATKTEADAQTSTTLAVTPAGLADFVRSTAGTSTDNAIARYDGTSADVQDSSVTIDDSGSLNIPSGQSFKIDSTSVLSGSTLGSGVTSSSLTSVGTLSSGDATAIVDAASTTAAGKVELATEPEAAAKSSSALAVTPAGLASYERSYSSDFSSSTGQTVTAATHGITTVTDVTIEEDDGTNYFAIGAQVTIAKATQSVTWAINGSGINGRITISGR